MNDLFWGDEEELALLWGDNDNDDADGVSGDGVAGPETGPTADSSDEVAGRTAPTAEEAREAMDSLVRAAFLQGVRTLASGSKAKQKKVFPMLASAFQSTVLLPNRPKGADLNLKKSSYKKLGVLLQAMAEVSSEKSECVWADDELRPDQRTRLSVRLDCD